MHIYSKSKEENKSTRMSFQGTTSYFQKFIRKSVSKIICFILKIKPLTTDIYTFLFCKFIQIPEFECNKSGKRKYKISFG